MGKAEALVVLGDGDPDGLALLEIAAQDALCEGVFDVALDRATQRPRAVVLVEALRDEEVDGGLVELERDALLLEAHFHFRELEVHDALQVCVGERVEDHQLVEAVEELRAEVSLDLDHHVVLDLLLALVFLGLALASGHAVEAELRARLHVLRAEVGGHDEDHVAEVDVAPEGVCEASLFHDLEEHVEDVRVRLLDLVKEHDRVGATTHTLGELAALLIADVARRRADEARGVVLLHVLAHVHGDDCVFVTKEELCELLAEVGLAHARGAEEQE